MSGLWDGVKKDLWFCDLDFVDGVADWEDWKPEARAGNPELSGYARDEGDGGDFGDAVGKIDELIIKEVTPDLPVSTYMKPT